jgi:hypothetical protein
MTTISFARHQFPPAIIRHTVWLDLRLTPSYRDVEDLPAERGLDVSYGTVRRWALRFGPLFAKLGASGRGKIGIGFERDHTEAFLQIEFGIFSFMHSDLVDQISQIIRDHQAPPKLSYPVQQRSETRTVKLSSRQGCVSLERINQVGPRRKDFQAQASSTRAAESSLQDPARWRIFRPLVLAP